MRLLTCACLTILIALLIASPAAGLASATESPVPGAVTVTGPSVARTLVLANDTLLQGNVIVKSGTATPSPWGMAFDPSNGDLYVAVVNSNSVAVINGVTDSIVGNVTVGYSPMDIVYDASNGCLYATNAGADYVSVINGTTNSVVANVTTGFSPASGAYDSQNGYVYVGQFSAGNTSRVYAINGATNTVVGNTTVSGMVTPMRGIAFNSANGAVYVVGYSNWVTVINGSTGSRVRSVAGLNEASTVVSDSANGHVYVTEGSSSVAVISGRTDAILSRVVVGRHPLGIGYDPSNGFIYVAVEGSNLVSVIDGRSNMVIQNIPVGMDPHSVAFDSQNGQLYVSNSGTVSIISLSTSPSGATGYTIALATAIVAAALVFGLIGWRRHSRFAPRRTHNQNMNSSAL